MKFVVVLMSFVLIIAQTANAFVGRGDGDGGGSDRRGGRFGGGSTPSRSSIGSGFGRDDGEQSTRERRRSSPDGGSSAIAIVDSDDSAASAIVESGFGDSDASAIAEPDPRETDTIVSLPPPPPRHVPSTPPPPTHVSTPPHVSSPSSSPPIISVPPPPSYSIPELIDLGPPPPPPAATIEPQDVVLPSEPTPVTFPVDFSTNEASVRTSIFQGDVQATADTMIISDADSIGAGLTYEEELSSLVEPSSNRNSDPDVVAFKALATAAIDTGDASRFGSAVVISFDQDGTTGIFTPQQIDELVTAFTADFSNATELNQIVSANANLNLGKRKLQLAGKSPVNSFVCSSCWPQKQCKKLFWC